MSGNGPRIEKLDFTPRFQREFSALGPDLQREAAEVFKQMRQQPLPRTLRFHKLQGYRSPALYSVDVTGNKSHKISFSLEGDTAVLRRIAPHKQIDRSP